MLLRHRALSYLLVSAKGRRHTRILSVLVAYPLLLLLLLLHHSNSPHYNNNCPGTDYFWAIGN